LHQRRPLPSSSWHRGRNSSGGVGIGTGVIGIIGAGIIAIGTAATVIGAITSMAGITATGTITGIGLMGTGVIGPIGCAAAAGSIRAARIDDPPCRMNAVQDGDPRAIG
jgi:hypothetical protein